MRLIEARSIIHQVSGNTYPWLKAWGMSLIKAAVYTIENRVSATDEDRELAEGVNRKILRKW